jgi:predicted phosphodiesterase
VIIALFSDIHSNREALEACLADAAAHGAEQHVFLGDIVGYNADPHFVIETIADLAAKGAIVIKGNHDVAVVSPERDPDTGNAALIAVEWTKTQLDEAEKAFLNGLPYSAALGDLLFVHGDASDPSGWIYVTGAEEAEQSMRATPSRVTFSGHVHRPLLTYMSPEADARSAKSVIPATGTAHRLEPALKWHAVLGSVGQPRDENSASAYALYDDATHELTYMRVNYDIAKAADKVRNAGLPRKLADRLFLGH